MSFESYVISLENMKKTDNKSVQIMTKYEKSRIIGTRATALAYDAPPYVDTTGMKSTIDIAKKELKEKVIPYIIRRRFPNDKFEDWQIKDLIIPM